MRFKNKSNYPLEDSTAVEHSMCLWRRCMDLSCSRIEHFFDLYFSLHFDCVAKNNDAQDKLFWHTFYSNVEYSNASKDEVTHIIHQFTDSHMCYLCEMNNLTPDSVTTFYEILQQNLNEQNKSILADDIVLIKTRFDEICELNVRAKTSEDTKSGEVVTGETKMNFKIQLHQDMQGTMIPIIYHIKY